MFDITKLALKLPNFLTHEECNSLISEFHTRNSESQNEHSANSLTGDISISNYNVIEVLPNTSNFTLLKNKTQLAVKNYITYLSNSGYFFTELLREQLNFSHRYRIMEYKENSNIHTHSDADNSNFIHGSITFNLNENYEGGDFVFFNGNYKVPLSKGDALIFPADAFWTHEVTKVTKGTRYSINSFLTNTPNEVRNNINFLHELIDKNYLEKTPPEFLLGPYN